MRLLFVCFCLCVISFANTEESLLAYGKNLYENPRGISCNKCHGDKGQGSVIAKYKHKGINKTLVAPRINHLSFSDFAKALSKQSGVMPRYYLSNEEIKAIYEYLTN